MDGRRVVVLGLRADVKLNMHPWPHDKSPFIVYDDVERERILRMALNGDLAACRVIENHKAALTAMIEMEVIRVGYLEARNV